jgi:hypothetical protein
MTTQLIIRVFFVLLVVFLYLILGIFLVDLDTKYLLLITFVFFEYYLGLFSSVKFKIKKEISEEGISITNHIKYDGNKEVAILLEEISGIYDVHPEIAYSNKENEILDYPPKDPVCLDPKHPSCTIKINLYFKHNIPSPPPRELFGRYGIYFVKLRFRINSRKKSKIILLFRKAKK